MMTPIEIVELGQDCVIRVPQDQDRPTPELCDEVRIGVVRLLHDGRAVPPVPDLAPVAPHLQLEIFVHRA